MRGWEGRRAAGPRRAARLARAPPLAPARRPRAAEPDPLRARLFWAAEAVFAVSFAAAVLLVAWSPDVWLTEKPMDMAFLNAANRAQTFPPEDPWFAGADLNYYYLGHLAMGILVKLGDLRPDEGYNVAVAALLALTATAVFTLAATLWAAARGPAKAVRAGLGALLVVVVLGNLEGARILLADGGPLREYDWFAASRIDPDTIMEFPWFSFLLGDLHAHVLAVPVHGARARLRAAGRARRPAARAARARARRAAGGRARARAPVRDQLLVLSRDRGRARPRRARLAVRRRAARPRGPRPSAGSWRRSR